MSENNDKSLGEYADQAWQWLVNHPLRRPIIVGTMGVIGGFWIGHKSYVHEKAKDAHIPTVFSDIESTKKTFGYRNDTVPPLTILYSSINDAPMKVFESHNIGMEITGNLSTIAREFETRTDRARRVYKQLPEYAATIDRDTDAALKSLEKYTAALRDLPPIIDALQRAWDEDRDDIDRPEEKVSYVEECDDEGKNCETKKVVETIYVYDHSEYTFTYDRAEGRKAYKLLNAFIQKYPDLDITEKLVLATKVGAWNEYAIEKSTQVNPGDRIEPQKLLDMVNIWATSSNFARLSPGISQNYNNMAGQKAEFNNAVKTARTEEIELPYKTYEGPQSYQQMEGALSDLQKVHGSAATIIGGLEFARKNIPILCEKTKEAIAINLDGKPGDKEKSIEAVIELAQDIIDKNFIAGHNVHPGEMGYVFLFAILGIAGFAAAGLGVDELIKRQQGRKNNGGFSPTSRKPDNGFQL